MLTKEQGNAGLVFRVSQPGTGQDDFHGYYAGFDTKTLYLGKMVNGKWQPLTTYDLTKLDCKVKTDVWNQIRVAIEGNRIRIWFNRMHESADKENGLWIDYTDPEPIPKGNVGMRTFQTTANFDNFIVLPIDSVPNKPILTPAACGCIKIWRGDFFRLNGTKNAHYHAVRLK